MNLIRAFIAGAQFAIRTNQLAQDAKAKKDEAEGHWVTIGAEAGADGEKHGGRPVFIAGSKPESKKAASKKPENKKPENKKPENKKAESKKAETKKAESKKAESKKAEAKKPEAKKAEAKKPEAKKAAIKAAEDKYNLSIGDFLKSQKHTPGSFAKELMYCLPGKADTFEKLCSNLSDDCKYLVKHALSSVKYHVLSPDKGGAFYSNSNQSINFKAKVFKNGNYDCARTNHQVMMHEFGHAVDGYPLTKGIAPKITMNTILLNAIKTDTSRLISALRVEANKHYIGTPSSQQVEDYRVATYLSDLMRSRDQQAGMPPAVVSCVSDMISAHTMNAIKDGGYHKTSYWNESKFRVSTEFMAHVFETSVDPELKKNFYKLFPTATKVLEELISDTATTIRKEVAAGKIK